MGERKHKIQPIISEEAYLAAVNLRVYERCTTSDIVDRAIIEYAKKRMPQRPDQQTKAAAAE